MSITQLQKDIQSGQLDKIYYICGDEPFLKNFYLQQIKKVLFDEGGIDTDFYIFEADKLTVEAFCDTMDLFPVQAQKKMIQITDCIFSKSPVCTYLTTHPEILSEDTVLVFFEQTVKNNKTTEAAKSFLKQVKVFGKVIQIDKLDQKTLLRWIEKQCRIHQLKMSASTVEYFLDCVGDDMYTLLSQLKKLSAFCQDTPVTEAQIDALCTRSTDSQGYLLTDAIWNKNATKAYQLLSDFESQKISAELIAGTIFNFVGRLYKVKLLAESGKCIPEIAQILGMKEYPVKKYCAYIHQIAQPHINKMLDLCAEADLAIKTTAVDNYILLAQLTAQLIQTL